MPRQTAGGYPPTVCAVRQILEKNDFAVGSKTLVGVTHINNPQSFFVRIRILDLHMGALEVCGEPVNPLDLYPQMRVLYKSQIEDKYVRGKVFFIDGSDQDMKCGIFAIDYGYFEKEIPVNEICTSGNVWDFDIEPLAVHCQLPYCFPFQGKWCKNVTLTLKYYTGEVRFEALLTVRKRLPDICVVELWNSRPDDLATTLVNASCSLHCSISNAASTSRGPEAEQHNFVLKDLIVGDTLRATVHAWKQPWRFFVGDKKDYEVYLWERLSITKDARLNTLSMEKMLVDTHVAVYMGGTVFYERGTIRKIIGEERVQIELVDGGDDTRNMKLNLLKPLSAEYDRYPVTAVCCAVVDQHRVFAKSGLLLGVDFVMKVVKVGHKLDVPHQVSVLSMNGSTENDVPFHLSVSSMIRSFFESL